MLKLCQVFLLRTNSIRHISFPKFPCWNNSSCNIVFDNYQSNLDGHDFPSIDVTSNFF